MSISSKIAPHLPYLRRIARALTGTRSGGDALVVATLETVIQLPGSLPDPANLRIMLYRTLVRIWQAAPGDRDHTDGPASGFLQEILQHLAPHARIALVMSSLEGLNAGQVATILDCPSSEVEQLIASARQDLTNRVAISVAGGKPGLPAPLDSRTRRYVCPPCRGEQARAGQAADRGVNRVSNGKPQTPVEGGRRSPIAGRTIHRPHDIL
jgi:DNA-directed RNA polymerase specialized sigma24 family protein